MTIDKLKKPINYAQGSKQSFNAVLPDARKFRLAGIAPEMEEKLDIMFGGVVSTGSNAWGTIEGGLDFSEGHADCEGTEQSHDLDENVPPPPLGTSQSSGTKRPRPSEPDLHRRKKGTAKVILEQVSGLLDVCTNMTIGDQRQMDAPSIGTTIGDLYSMPEIGPNKPLFLFSITFLEQPSKREIFVALSYEDKVAYLRQEYDKQLRQEFANTSRASSSRGG